MKDQIIRNSFRYSFERSLPILIGFFPLGVAFGILMSSVGYNFLWAGLTSLIVYAGSLQFLMVSFFTDETSLVTVAVMALLLNSRHLFYGL
jgi:4-azaleucine resistance transporter AzlC